MPFIMVRIAQTVTVDTGEVERFSRIAAEWWDENGKFKPLHRMNPMRVRYIRDQVCAHFRRSSEEMHSLAGLMALDAGCGGGLLSEPMARLGAHVIGIDASQENVRVATSHAKKGGLAITYLCTTPESLAVTGGWPMPIRAPGYVPQANDHLFDVVLALEVIEHVANPRAFLAACAALTRPGGMLFMSTINRTYKSYAMAIIMAERVLRWLPPETHNWNRFLKPSELCDGLRQIGFTITNMSGMVFN